MNPYVKLDGKKRYGNDDTVTASTGSSFCTGDFYTATVHPMVTSFEMRQQTDTQDPMQGAPITGCIKQYKTGTGAGAGGVPVAGDLLSTSTSYDDQLAQVFHNWTTLCTFTPTRDGDYYLHVRSNVSASGTSSANTNGNGAIIYSGNSAVSAKTGNSTYGEGDNSFGIRLVTDPGYENLVSVAGFDRMPIFANADAATSTINLIRVLPGAAGQYVSFSFFDVGDASAAGTVKVLPPTDATGTITSTPYPGGCRSELNDVTSSVATLTNCTANISNSQNNGMKEEMSIPIPSDYTCNYASNGGCWYRVQVSFPSGTVNDITTWDASIVGDPVRLIK
jgi:hypothetical protein